MKTFHLIKNEPHIGCPKKSVPVSHEKVLFSFSVSVPGPPLKPLGAEVGADAMSCKEERNLSAVDSSLTAENKAAFKQWKKHDDKKEYFCELDGKI